jgi:hypothetical protein
VSTIRPLTAAILGAFVMTSLSLAPVAAKRPAPPEPAPPPPSGAEEPPLTPVQEAASAAKVAASEMYLAQQAKSGADLVPLACIYPTAGTTTAEDGASPDASIESSCSTPYATLPVEARDQVHGHYCGPAVGQVIANYSWAMASGKNRYSQATIAGWMGTDTYGSTNANRLEAGLKRATAGSPRLPANWDWAVTYLRDTNGNGLVSDQLHGYVRTSISSFKMPLAIPVRPHDRNAKYHLVSWPRPVASVGHWIAAYGWYAYWTNSDTPQIGYTDSARDEGGSTGKFWDPTRHLAQMIMDHTGRFVW